MKSPIAGCEKWVRSRSAERAGESQGCPGQAFGQSRGKRRGGARAVGFAKRSEQRSRVVAKACVARSRAWATKASRVDSALVMMCARVCISSRSSATRPFFACGGPSTVSMGSGGAGAARSLGAGLARAEASTTLRWLGTDEADSEGRPGSEAPGACQGRARGVIRAEPAHRTAWAAWLAERLGGPPASASLGLFQRILD